MSKPISENKRNMILNGSLSQAILMLAVPVMINSFIQSMYNLTDTFWLGRIGTENQSAKRLYHHSKISLPALEMVSQPRVLF